MHMETVYFNYPTGLFIVKVYQSCSTLCDPMDYTVHGILQARKLEWVTCPFSRGSSRPKNWTRVSCTAGRFFTNWAATEALGKVASGIKLRNWGQIHYTVKNLTANAGDQGSVPGEGNGSPLQCSCLEDSMDRGAWWAAVHGVAESHTTEEN